MQSPSSRFKVSALWVLPLAFLFVSYLQNIKDKADAALSLGVVKDPKVGVGRSLSRGEQQNDLAPSDRTPDAESLILWMQLWSQMLNSCWYTLTSVGFT